MAVEGKIIITASSAGKRYWKDLWRNRELFYVLAWRDLKVRYKQAYLGIAWAVLRPAIATLLFTWVFHRLAKMPSMPGIPYALQVLSGLLPWQFFSGALIDASNSLTGNAGLITKVYFPRLLVPASTVLSSLVDFCIAMGILAALFLFYGFIPPLQVVFLPMFAIMAMAVALGAGCLAAALQVRYRDIRFIVPFLVQFGLFVTPVGYLSGIVPERFRYWYALNPMVGVIDGFRWCLLGVPVHWPSLAVSMGAAAGLLWIGLIYFRRMERGFADNI